MTNIAVIMPAAAAIGVTIILIVILIIRGMNKRAGMESINAADFSRFAEIINRENAEIRKDLEVIKEKVEAIDKMMKDI